MLQTNLGGRELSIIRVNGSSLTVEKVKKSLEGYIPERYIKPMAETACRIFANREYVFIDSDDEMYELSYEGKQLSLKTSKMCTAMVLTVSRDISEDGKSNLYDFARKTIIACDYARIRKFENCKENNPKAPWIPKGYHHVTGDTYTGYVVSDKIGNEFTYIPYLDIYVSRYEISKGSAGEARSVPKARVWTNVSFKEASKAARKFDPVNKSSLLSSIVDVENAVKEHLQHVKFGTKVVFTYSGVTEIKTGAIPENMVYNLDCLYGNHYCIVDNGTREGTAEGSSYKDSKGYDDTYIMSDSHAVPSKETGFRICLRRD